MGVSGLERLALSIYWHVIPWCRLAYSQSFNQSVIYLYQTKVHKTSYFVYFVIFCTLLFFTQNV